jgi:hypothetical protein
MPYGAWDEQFIHQLPRTLDHVSDSEKSWSDRCYFNLHPPDDSMLIVSGYGNYPNTQSAHGYAKVALADGRHWDLDAGRRVTTDRGDLHAGPMRWTCVEPLERWLLELGPNESGIEWELHYESVAPLWELLPISVRKNGRTLADFQHIKQPARYTGWVKIEGEEISVDGFSGGRDRTFGVRDAYEIDFWIWFEAVFEDRAIEAWVFESADGTVQYVDGGFTFNDGQLSKRFVSFRHDVTFDGDRKRPIHADIIFVDQHGETFHVVAAAQHPHTTAYYGPGLDRRVSDGKGLSYYVWNGNDAADLDEVESRAMSLDQLMGFELDGMTGHGIFELFSAGDHYPRYPNW